MRESFNGLNIISEGNFRKDAHPEVNRADINLTQLKRNLDVLRGRLKPETKFLAVVKGDAYGHGLVPIAVELERNNCDFIGVVRLTEALSLREAGIRMPVLMLAPFIPAQIDWIVESDITVMLDRECDASNLQSCCERKNKKINVHIKVNTGLNRYGLQPDKVADFIKKMYYNYPNLNIEGIYTHFKDAEFNPAFTHQQIDKFNSLLDNLKKEGLRPPLAHASGSGGFLLYPEAHFELVRCGIVLYGIEHKAEENILPHGVKPLMTLKSYILRIDNITAGESGGYGDSFIAARDSKIAIIGIGYGDGISRGWKEVLVSGQRAPVVNYFMDGIIADITDIKGEVREYDEVVIIGGQGNEYICWKEACGKMNAYIDEQFQRLTERIPKYYFYEN